MTIHEFDRRLKKLSLRVEGLNAVVQTDTDFYSIQTSQLVVDGLDANGKHLKKYISKKYADKKHKMNSFPGYGNPDLKYTGAFLRALKIEVKSSIEFEILSSDEKYSALVKKYGNTILGLNKDSEKRYKEKAWHNQFVTNCKKKLFYK
jgi:hypothetical protein